jgi:phosphoribosylanthranilate isomerase
MTRVKICGIKTKDALEAAVNAGAAYVGFVHFPQSPRHIAPEAAGVLRAQLPSHVKAVSVVVDASDEQLERICAHVMPDVLQLHGRETPARMREIRDRFHVPVMKTVAVENAEDVGRARNYADADMLLFDAKPPKGAKLPGGNAVAFDWNLLAKLSITQPWMLSGGLTAQNVAEAIRASGAQMVDVSSGVEASAGVKDVQKIAGFCSILRDA